MKNREDLKRERADKTARSKFSIRKSSVLCFFRTVFLFKSLNTTRRVDKFLFSGKEWMAV